jgi:hypothetical protein
MMLPAPGPKTWLGLFLLLCGLAGCQTGPAVMENSVTQAPPMIRLCGCDVPAESAAVQTEVLRHVVPGMPVETARTRLEEFGFHCLYAGVFDKKPVSYHPARSLPELIVGRNAHKDRLFHSLVCSSSPNEIRNW